MKTSRISSLFARGAIGAAVAMALAGAAHAQFATTGGTFDLPFTPDNGMACRGSYAASFGGNVLRCSKNVEVKVALACLDSPFTVYVARAPAPGTPEGLDVCAKPNGVVITATSDISTLVKGKDYKFAKADTAKINEKVASTRQDEATALGLQLKDVDASGGEPSTDTTSGDSFDKSKVAVTLFTFAVPNSGVLVPARAGAFVPRPLK